jgi:hypothetical protein
MMIEGRVDARSMLNILRSSLCIITNPLICEKFWRQTDAPPRRTPSYVVRTVYKVRTRDIPV